MDTCEIGRYHTLLLGVYDVCRRLSSEFVILSINTDLIYDISDLNANNFLNSRTDLKNQTNLHRICGKSTLNVYSIYKTCRLLQSSILWAVKGFMNNEPPLKELIYCICHWLRPLYTFIIKWRERQEIWRSWLTSLRWKEIYWNVPPFSYALLGSNRACSCYRVLLNII